MKRLLKGCLIAIGGCIVLGGAVVILLLKGADEGNRAAEAPCVSIVYPNFGYGLSDYPDYAEKLQATVKDYLKKYFL